MERNPFANWFEKKFVEWEAETGRRRTVSEFSEWIEIPRSLCSRYLTGSRTPSRKTADTIATKLGPEVYDLLGMQRPDAILQRLQLLWDRFGEEQKGRVVQIMEEVENHTAQP